MPYDAQLDESLFSKSWETEELRITVSVFSYNKGQKKMQISRQTKTAEEEFRFVKLGRMSKEEASAVLPLMQEALPFMD
ncbi:hypothetical protein ACFL1E_04985 [Candidatus Omnitrophota bacterium]